MRPAPPASQSRLPWLSTHHRIPRRFSGELTSSTPPKSVHAFTLYFLLFPLWWLVGLGQLGFIALAVPMGLHLLKRRGVAAPRGFALWLLFLGVLVASSPAIWSRVPGLAPPGGAERLITFGFWVAWFIAATVFLLYLGNVSDRELPTTRVIDLMALMFLVTVVGAYAGQFLWRVEFPSLLEVVLPGAVTDVRLVEIMIHPGLAQIQDIIGYEAPRPKAPWTFANTWGANYGLLLPFFVLAFTGPRVSAARRVALIPLALLALPPVVFSLNRGMWAGLLAVGCYVAVRLALLGRFLVLGLLATASVVAGYVVVRTPLGEVLLARLANPHSNQGRANLAGETVATVLAYSPVVGFGTPRAMEGNFFSVAAGATEGCPKCSPPQLGTQGSLWFVIFTTGLVGAFMFCAFLLRRYVAGLRQRTALGIALTSTGVYLAVVIWVYDIIGPSLIFVTVALALMWRAEQQDVPGRGDPRPRAGVIVP